jgi:hypothetical protein
VYQNNGRDAAIVRMAQRTLEGRVFAADIVGYLFGYAQLANARALALVGDPEAVALRAPFFLFEARGQRPVLGFGSLKWDMEGFGANHALACPAARQIGCFWHKANLSRLYWLMNDQLTGIPPGNS